MSNIPLDLERSCEQRWASRFSAARSLRAQHRVEGQRPFGTSVQLHYEHEAANLRKQAEGMPLSIRRDELARQANQAESDLRDEEGGDT